MNRKHLRLLCLVFGILVLGSWSVRSASVLAQTSTRDRGIYYGGSVVGGVEIDTEGILRTAPKKTMEEVGKTLGRLLEPIPGDLAASTPIRKISLKKLDENMRKIIAERGEFPDSMRYLGGLTAIRYLVVVPEENDVLLVGPAEGWKVDHAGNILGKSSGRPVLRLEDLVTIYRSWIPNERPSVITCSIDPTPEAMGRIAQLDRRFGVRNAQNIHAYAEEQEKAYGMNVVAIQGVPEDSRFAKILVAADYKMKRIGLGQEPSQVRGLPSYTSLISGSQKQINPRFWLAPEYGTVVHDSKKLTWQLSGVKVKAMTEDEFVDSRSGMRQSSGRPDPAAINWCNKMNTHYETLAKIDPVFGELKNCMELAIAVALIKREGLLEKAGCSLPTFADEAALKLKYPVPRQVPSQATVSRNGRTFVVACGGVEINPFATLESTDLDNKIDSERESLAKMSTESWWSQ